MNMARNYQSAGRIATAGGLLALLVTACVTPSKAHKPVSELWYAHVAPPGWVDGACRSKAPRRGEELAAYARRVPSFDLDCVRDQSPDIAPDRTGNVRYLIANTLMYIQRFRSDQTAFAPVDIIGRMDLKRASDDPLILYTAAELLFHGAAFHPEEANRYVPCAERLAWRAVDLGYAAAIWSLKRNEAERVKYPNNAPCNIPSLREMLD